jgi:peptidoglycan/LPS O-acetylase OafA/YrhL
MFVVFPLNILMAFLCAAVSYHLVETPFLRMKQRFEPGHAPAAPPSARRPETPPVLPRSGESVAS